MLLGLVTDIQLKQTQNDKKQSDNKCTQKQEWPQQFTGMKIFCPKKSKFSFIE